LCGLVPFGGDAEVSPLVVAVDAGWHGDAPRSRARLSAVLRKPSAYGPFGTG